MFILHSLHNYNNKRLGVTKQMRNFISTPNIAIKRKLKEQFKVFNIDEFRTSCLYHRTEEKGEHLYYIDKINKKRKLHSVLTFQMETIESKCNYRLDCINRDYNGCLNIRKIFNSYMRDKTRPLRYTRGYELITTTNPSSEASNSSRLEGD